MRKHLNIKIFGFVQGVLFRDSARNKAEGLNIEGFVRNELDGTVYIEAEGEEGDLKKFLEWCRQGPGSARVEDVDVKEGEVRGFKEFSIEF